MTWSNFSADAFALLVLLGAMCVGYCAGRNSPRRSRYKRKLNYGWTCSDTAHHVHGWYWAAWACGKWQQFRNRKGTQ